MKTTAQLTSTLNDDPRRAILAVLACISDEDRVVIVRSSPVARAFAIGLACMIGPAGLRAFLKDTRTSETTLDEAVFRIHRAWFGPALETMRG